MLLYNINDIYDIKQCLDENGVVGIKDVLNQQEINDSVQEIELLVQHECKSNKFKFNDPNTYYLSDQIMNSYGVLGKQPLFTKQLTANRYNPNILKSYSIAYDMEPNKIFPHHDRVGWLRPTIGPNYEDWSKYKIPFSKPGLHLDVDPIGYFEESNAGLVDKFINNLEYKSVDDFIKENNAKNITMGTHYQGILNLFDNDDQDGGFHCVLGGHKIIKNWYEDVKKLLPKTELVGRYIFKSTSAIDMKYFDCETTRIPCPAGTLIIFDAVLPHGTKPNHSQNSRLIQFLKYTPINIFNDKTFKKRSKALDKLLLG